MNKKLYYITQKVDAIQFGLLRYHDKGGRLTMHVKARISGGDFLICTPIGNEDMEKLVYKRVNLIQKSEKDYLYISGEIKEKIHRNKKALFISIIKACWFEKKSRGNLSWLQEKHIYDISPQDELELVS